MRSDGANISKNLEISINCIESNYDDTRHSLKEHQFNTLISKKSMSLQGGRFLQRVL